MGTNRAPLAAVLVAGLLGEFAFALLLLPLIQHYLVFDRHMPAGLPGYALSAYGLTRLVAQLPLGMLADAIDRRLAVAAGYFVVLLCGLALWAPMPALFVLVAAAGFGLGHALADPLIPAALTEAVEPHERGRAFGLLNLTQVAGLVSGLAGGAFLADLAPASLGFLVVAGCNGATLLLLSFGAAPLLAEHQYSGAGRAQRMWRSLVDERVIDLLAVLFVLTFAINIVMPDLSLYAVRQLHTSLHVVTLYLVPAAIVAIVTLPIGGWLADRYGHVPSLMAGAAVAALALISFVFIRQPWEAAIAASFGGIGIALTMPSSNALLMDVANPEHRALLLSGMMAVQGLGEAVGPFVGGLMTQAGGVVWPFVAAGFALWLAVPGAVFFASEPHAGDSNPVVTFTPFTRLVSRAHIRMYAWLAARHQRSASEPMTTAEAAVVSSSDQKK
ncbi:MAG TPA: MFS transporter [Dehalococcoidia bacterium]